MKVYECHKGSFPYLSLLLYCKGRGGVFDDHQG